jgi:NAD(P)H-nitrite reductase large subunit
VAEVLSRDGQVCEARLESGQRLACDLFLIAIGARANAGLAREAGIKVREGVLVDAYMQTSAERIYAAGDVAEAPLSQAEQRAPVANWWNAVQQGRVAGRNLTGEKVRYGGSVRASAFRLVGLPIVSVGELNAGSGQNWQLLDRSAHVYRRLAFRGGRLIGAIQVGGDVTDVGILSSLIKSGANVEGLQESLFADGLALFAGQRGRKLLAERLTSEPQ